MSRWDDGFQGHPFLGLLTETRNALDELQPDDASALESVERLRKVVALATAVTGRADPELVFTQQLDQLQGGLQSVLGEVHAFSENADQTHLQNAHSSADEILRALATWPIPISGEDLDDLRERGVSFRASVGQLLRRIEAEVTRLEEQQSALSTTLETMRGEATAQMQSVGQSTEARVGEANQRLDELAGSVDVQKSRLDQAIATFQQQFSEAEAQRSQRFEAATAEQHTELERLVQLLRQRGDKELDDVMQVAKERLEQISAKEGEARKLAAALGAIGVSGGHGEYARQQKRSADFWRWGSVGALLAVGVLAFVVLVQLPARGIDWQRFVTKLLISAPLVALAGYAAAQSARHRRAEREARKVDLDLAALELYVALFPPDQRDRIKEEIGLKIFGQPLSPEGRADRIGSAQLLDFLKTQQG